MKILGLTLRLWNFKPEVSAIPVRAARGLVSLGTSRFFSRFFENREYLRYLSFFEVDTKIIISRCWRDELDDATKFDLRPTVERKSGKNSFMNFKLPLSFSRPIVIRSAYLVHRRKRLVETNLTVPGSRPYDHPFGRYEFFSLKPLKIAKFLNTRV
jgi:hypothetical protein